MPTLQLILTISMVMFGELNKIDFISYYTRMYSGMSCNVGGAVRYKQIAREHYVR